MEPTRIQEALEKIREVEEWVKTVSPSMCCEPCEKKAFTRLLEEHNTSVPYLLRLVEAYREVAYGRVAERYRILERIVAPDAYQENAFRNEVEAEVQARMKGKK